MQKLSICVGQGQEQGVGVKGVGGQGGVAETLHKWLQHTYCCGEHQYTRFREKAQ